MVREGQDADRVSADQRRRNRSLGRRRPFPTLEYWRVAALRQVDGDLVAGALLLVIANQLGAQPPRLHPDDRIRSRIERRLLAEDMHADDVLLELGAASADRFEDDEAEEALEAIDLLEGGAGQRAFELLSTRLVGVARHGRGDITQRHAPYLPPEQPLTERETISEIDI